MPVNLGVEFHGAVNAQRAGASRRTEPAWQVRADWALLVTGIAVLFAIPHDVRGDGLGRFHALEGLLRSGVLRSTRYSVVGPLFAAPLYVVGWAFGSPATVCAYFNVLLFVVFLYLFWRELRLRVSSEDARRFLLLLVYGSMFPSHIQFFYGEVFTALFVGLGVMLLSRRRAFAGWLLVGLGALNTPASILGTAFVALAYACTTRRWRYVAIPIGVFALSRLESLVCRGSLWATGYEGDGAGPGSPYLQYQGLPGFSYPLFFGILSITLSFGKGLVFFAPGLLAPFEGPPSLRRARNDLLLFLAGLVLVYARWWSWQGGRFWGPRFFLIASIPACLALASVLRSGSAPPRASRCTPDRGVDLGDAPGQSPDRQSASGPSSDLIDAPPRSLAVNGALLAATALSFWAGVNGLVFDTTGLDFCQTQPSTEPYCLYVPELSVLWHPIVSFTSAVPPPTRHLALAVIAFWAVAWLYVARNLLATVATQAVEAARSSLQRLEGGWRL